MTYNVSGLYINNGKALIEELLSTESGSLLRHVSLCRNRFSASMMLELKSVTDVFDLNREVHSYYNSYTTDFYFSRDVVICPESTFYGTIGKVRNCDEMVVNNLLNVYSVSSGLLSRLIKVTYLLIRECITGHVDVLTKLLQVLMRYINYELLYTHTKAEFTTYLSKLYASLFIQPIHIYISDMAGISNISYTSLNIFNLNKHLLNEKKRVIKPNSSYIVNRLNRVSWFSTC